MSENHSPFQRFATRNEKKNKKDDVQYSEVKDKNSRGSFDFGLKKAIGECNFKYENDLNNYFKSRKLFGTLKII